MAGNYHYVCLPHSPDMAGGFTAAVLTPTKLDLFSLIGSKESVTLKWKAVNEQNVDYYTVRKSLDGITYRDLARIEAGQTNENEYTFMDKDLSGDQKFSYYHIAIIGKDGEKSFSETKLYKNVGATTKLIVSLNPNPITRPGHLNVVFNSDKEGKMEVRVLSSSGKTILSTTLQAYAGVNKGHIHLGELPSGTYVLLCSLNGEKETHRLVFK